MIIAFNADRPEQPVVLHGVQHLFHPPVLLPARPSEGRRTRIVFITRDLPQDAIERSLAAFEAADEPLAPPPPLPTGRSSPITPRSPRTRRSRCSWRPTRSGRKAVPVSRLGIWQSYLSA